MIWLALLVAAALNLAGSIFVYQGAKTNRRTQAILQGILTQGEES